VTASLCFVAAFTFDAKLDHRPKLFGIRQNLCGKAT